MRSPGDTYQPDLGEHEGHVVTVVAVSVPGERQYGDEIEFIDETWVECQCGARWGFVEETEGEDGWPD